ncbi:MAG: GNAT family N-acetyltransferase [Acidobacteriales bacterium]|nr:GNAT family N-acetyltransferase [Terriglobales bacterium]
MTVNIIEATIGDLDLIAPLFDQYRQFYKQSSDVAQGRAFLQQRLRNKESVVYLAMGGSDGRQAIGFIQLYPVFCSIALKRLWILNDLYVIPEARHSGVARLLMDRARRLMQESDAVSMFLETANDNLPAQRLYEGLGWKRETVFVKFNLFPA